MKATGIVRRIDELGRIVIPKEIRRTFKIKEGTPLEIFCGDNDELVLKKYSMLSEISDFAEEICSALFATLSLPVIICDKDKIVAISGMSKSMMLGKNISTRLEKQMDNRKDIVFNKLDGDNLLSLIEEDVNDYFAQVVVPILSNGDVYGAIVCFTKEQSRLGSVEKSVLKGMANFLAEQLT